MGDTRKCNHEKTEDPPFKDAEFNSLTFQHPTRECGECPYCTEETNAYLDCCQKPICRECFGRLYHEFGETQCSHCREALFENGMCYVCKTRHTGGYKDVEAVRTRLQQIFAWFLIKRMIENTRTNTIEDADSTSS